MGILQIWHENKHIATLDYIAFPGYDNGTIADLLQDILPENAILLSQLSRFPKHAIWEYHEFSIQIKEQKDIADQEIDLPHSVISNPMSPIYRDQIRFGQQEITSALKFLGFEFSISKQIISFLDVHEFLQKTHQRHYLQTPEEVFPLPKQQEIIWECVPRRAKNQHFIVVIQDDQQQKIYAVYNNCLVFHPRFSNGVTSSVFLDTITHKIVYTIRIDPILIRY